MELRHELRPCLVNDKRCLFHCWEQYSKIIPPSLYTGGHSGGVNAAVYALVEDDLGLIHRVSPLDIRFTDNKHSEYCFEEEK